MERFMGMKPRVVWFANSVLTGYVTPMTRHILPWLCSLAHLALVIVADPGRAYLPTRGMEKIAQFDVPVTLELEDRLVRTTVLYRVLPETI